MFNCEVNRTLMYSLSVSDGSVLSIATKNVHPRAGNTFAPKMIYDFAKNDTFFFLSCQIINFILTL